MIEGMGTTGACRRSGPGNGLPNTCKPLFGKTSALVHRSQAAYTRSLAAPEFSRLESDCDVDRDTTVGSGRSERRHGRQVHR
jgi:hypothetical protein